MADEESQSTPDAEPVQPLPAAAAWEPFTPRGIAAFAGASFGRLFVVELIVALLAAGVAVWFLYAAWFPGITEAIRLLPQKSLIDYGELKWTGKPLETVHERRPFFAFVVDLEGKSRGNPGTDLSLHFRKHECELWSPLGRLFFPYPREYQIEFNRPELEPRWGAWAPIILGLAAFAVPASLLIAWAFLAILYFGPAWLLAFFTNRQGTWGGCWRLASAALMPGACIFMAAIIMYGLAWLDFWHLMLAFTLHILAGWVFLVLGTLRLPSLPATVVAAGNPFQTSTVATTPSANPPNTEDPFRKESPPGQAPEGQ